MMEKVGWLRALSIWEVIETIIKQISNFKTHCSFLQTLNVPGSFGTSSGSAGKYTLCIVYFCVRFTRVEKSGPLLIVELHHSYGRYTSYGILSSVPSNFLNRIHAPIYQASFDAKAEYKHNPGPKTEVKPGIQAIGLNSSVARLALRSRWEVVIFVTC